MARISFRNPNSSDLSNSSRMRKRTCDRSIVPLVRWSSMRRRTDEQRRQILQTAPLRSKRMSSVTAADAQACCQRTEHRLDLKSQFARRGDDQRIDSFPFRWQGQQRKQKGEGLSEPVGLISIESRWAQSRQSLFLHRIELFIAALFSARVMISCSIHPFIYIDDKTQPPLLFL